MWRILKLLKRIHLLFCLVLSLGLVCVPVYANDLGVSPAVLHILQYETWWTFSQIASVQQVPSVGNLISYQLTFQDTSWGSPVIYIDKNAEYAINNSLYNGSPSASNAPGYTGQLITDNKTINSLINSSNMLSPYYDAPGNSTLFAQNYDNPKSALYAYLNPSTQTIFYTDTNQNFVDINGNIATNVFKNNGQTNGDTFSYTSKLAINYYQSASQLYSLMNNGNFGTIVEGSPNAPRTILVFGEPNCPVCNALYNLTKSYVASGQLQIHWSLVSFINPDSRGKILAILMGMVPANSGYPNTPAGALAYNEDNFTQGSDDGGAITPISVSNASQAAITESNNTEYFYFNEFTIIGTPTIVFKDTTGNFEIGSGLPANTSNGIQNFINSLYVNNQ